MGQLEDGKAFCVSLPFCMWLSEVISSLVKSYKPKKKKKKPEARDTLAWYVPSVFCQILMRLPCWVFWVLLTSMWSQVDLLLALRQI